MIAKTEKASLSEGGGICEANDGGSLDTHAACGGNSLSHGLCRDSSLKREPSPYSRFFLR